MPWGAQLLAWLAGLALVLLTWSLVSLPAYAIEKVFQRAGTRLAAFLQDQKEAFQAASEESSQLVRNSFDHFFRSHSYKDIRNRNPQLWEKTVKNIVRPMVATRDRLRSAEKQMGKLSVRVSNAAKQIDETKFEFPSIPPLKLDTDEELADVQQVHKARYQLTIVSFLILALVLVNVGMLSQILRDIVTVASIRVIGPMRLYHFLAMFLTTIEAGIGVLHAHFGLESEGRGRSYWPQGLTVLGATGFAFVEGFFYSRVGSADQSVQFPLGVTFTMEFAFFVLGFLLPLVLTGLGSVAYRSLMGTLEGHTLRHVKSQLKRSNKIARRLDATLERIKSNLHSVREEVHQLDQSLPQSSEEQTRKLVKTIDEQGKEIRKLAETKPVWAVNLVQELTEAEVQQEAHRVGAYLLATVATLGLSIWLGIYAFSALYPALQPWWVAAIAIASGTTLLACGLLLRPTPIAVDDAGALRPVDGFGYRVWSVVAALAVVAILGFETYVLAREAVPAGLGLPWVVVLGAGLALVALGRELASTVLMAVCCASAAVVLIRRFGVWLGLWLVRLLIGMMTVVEFIASLLAQPLRWILDILERPKRRAALQGKPETTNR